MTILRESFDIAYRSQRNHTNSCIDHLSTDMLSDDFNKIAKKSLFNTKRKKKAGN